MERVKNSAMSESKDEIVEKVIKINRVTKVVKGGKRPLPSLNHLSNTINLYDFLNNLIFRFRHRTILYSFHTFSYLKR